MKKLFNKRNIKIYVFLLCFTFVFASVSLIFSVNLSSKLTTAVEESNSESTDISDTSQIILNLITSAVSALSGDTSSSSDSTYIDKRLLDDDALAIYNKRTISIVLTVTMYILTALFTAGAITSYKYEKYLLSDKYKAKLRRMKKYEKCSNT